MRGSGEELPIAEPPAHLAFQAIRDSSSAPRGGELPLASARPSAATFPDTRGARHAQTHQFPPEHRQDGTARLHRGVDESWLRRHWHSHYRAPGRSYNFNPIVGNKDLERDVKGALKDSGLEVYDLYSFYLQPEMDWKTITPALEYGGEIGCKYVLVIGDDPEWTRMIDTMGR